MASPEMVWATALMVFLLAALILFFVIRGALRTTSISDYAIGSFRFSPVMVGLSLAASMTSAATFIINPGFIALYGLSGVLAWVVVLPASVFISLVVLTKSFRRQGETVKALTLAQWIGRRYDSKGFSLFFAFLALLLVTFIVLIAVGMAKVLAHALNVKEIYVLVGLIVYVFGYMMFGGANSMVYTNTIQALLMVVVAIILLGSGYEHFSSGVNGFVDKLAAIDPDLTRAFNPRSVLFRDFFESIVCSIVVGAAIVCQPHIITRSLMLKKESDVNRYLATGILAQALFFSVVFTGLYARLRFPDLTFNGTAIQMDNIIPTYVVQEFPVILGLIVVMGLLGAGLSTLEGLVQSLSTTITSDIINPLAGRLLGTEDNRAKRLVAVNKVVIILLAVVTILLSNQQLVRPNLSVGIFAQNGVYAYFSAAFMPVLMGIFLPKAPRIAAIGASVTAIVVYFASYYGGISWYLEGTVRNPAVAATIAILSSVVVGGVLYRAFRKNNSKF